MMLIPLKKYTDFFCVKPNSSEGKKDVRRFWWLAALLAFIIGVWYLYWRITATFNTEDN